MVFLATSCRVTALPEQNGEASPPAAVLVGKGGEDAVLLALHLSPAAQHQGGIPDSCCASSSLPFTEGVQALWGDPADQEEKLSEMSS